MDQYSRVLLPSKETLAQLKERTHDGARWKDLEVARRRARWEQVKREQDKKREDDKEAERGESPFVDYARVVECGRSDRDFLVPPPLLSRVC